MAENNNYNFTGWEDLKNNFLVEAINLEGVAYYFAEGAINKVEQDEIELLEILIEIILLVTRNFGNTFQLSLLPPTQL